MVEKNKQKLENVNIAGKNTNKNIIIFIMSNNSWIASVSIVAGLILVGLGYNMYSNNKEATANKVNYDAYIAKDDLEG